MYLGEYNIVLDEDGDAVLTHNCGDDLGEVVLYSLAELSDRAERHVCGEDDTDD